MLSKLLVVLYLSCAVSFVLAQSQQYICSPDNCITNTIETPYGALISPYDPPISLTSVQFVPGVYNTTSQLSGLPISPNLLISPSSTITPFPGFNASAVSQTLIISLSPGLVAYDQELYSGTSTYLELPSAPMNATPLSAKSLTLSKNVWMAVTFDSSASFVVFRDSLPRISQLPKNLSGTFTIIDLQSSTCSPPCSSGGVCSASNTCSCVKGFTGSFCENCAAGFSGPNCLAPTVNGTSVNGTLVNGTLINGTLVNGTSVNDTLGCNCVNGQCSEGNCTCNIGWTTAKNGTACAQCAEGYYLTSTGDCRICQLGCSDCADETGTCNTCQKGFVQNQADPTKCIQSPSVTSDGVTCPSGAFSDGVQCSPCSSSCSTCGSSADDCILCPQGASFFNGTCVMVGSSDGVCDGTNGMIANNNKNMCDTCGAKCTACKIPNFSPASTISQLNCTDCLPGSFLIDGKCIDGCPSGTFESLDKSTCEACSSNCSTCAGTADYCLTCDNQQFAMSGQCVSACPTGYYRSNSTCFQCHRDCASCSGPSFNQCSTCPQNRPVLDSGRCLRTCSNPAQYYDQSTSLCMSCDSTCTSCSGPGNDQCLGCPPDATLTNGSCAPGYCPELVTLFGGGECMMPT